LIPVEPDTGKSIINDTWAKIAAVINWSKPMTMVSCPLCGIEAYDYVQLYDALSVMVKDPALSYFVDPNRYHSLCEYINGPHPNIKVFSWSQNGCPHLKLAMAAAPKWGQGELAT
jgi:hypothetical protein